MVKIMTSGSSWTPLLYLSFTDVSDTGFHGLKWLSKLYFRPQTVGRAGCHPETPQQRNGLISGTSWSDNFCTWGGAFPSTKMWWGPPEWRAALQKRPQRSWWSRRQKSDLAADEGWRLLGCIGSGASGMREVIHPLHSTPLHTRTYGSSTELPRTRG